MNDLNWYNELSEYLKISREAIVSVFGDIDINKQWRECKSDTHFYSETNYYLYDLTNYVNDAGRMRYVEQLKNFIKTKSLKTALDYGCGIGTDIIAMYEAGIENMTAIDIYSASTQYMYWRLQNRKIIKGLMFYNIKNDDDYPKDLPKVDIGVCVAMLEHCQNPQAILRELVRVCKYLVLRVDPSNPGNAHPMHIEKNFPFLRAIDGENPEIIKEYGLKRIQDISEMPLFEIVK